MAGQQYSSSATSTSTLIARMKALREEREAANDLLIQNGIDNGTTTYAEQVTYLKTKLNDYFKGSSKYQSIANDIQSTQMQADEVDLQYKYKTGQINDDELLVVRQSQLLETEAGSQRNYSLQEEIYNLQKSKQQKQDQSEFQRHLLDYKYNYETADGHLSYLQSTYSYMTGAGAAFYTDADRSEMALKITEQQYTITDLNSTMASLTQDIAFKNGVDQVAAGQTYVTDLQTRLASERDPLERLRIQGMITTQEESNRSLERDRTEASYRISYAKREITDAQFLDNLNALATAEVNPDKKLQYQLEAGQQQRKVDQKAFDVSLSSVQNDYAVTQNERTYLDSLNALKQTYGTDSEFGFQLDSLLSQQTRRVMNDGFQKELQGLKNQYSKDQNGNTYLTGLQNMLTSYGADSVFSFELGKEIATQTGDVNQEKFNGEMSTLSNQLLLGNITEAQYQTSIQTVFGKYDFTASPQYQTKLATLIAGSQKNDMESTFNTKMATLENSFKTGELNATEYQSALEDVQKNAESYGFASLLNIPQYADRFDNVLTNVSSENLRTTMQAQIDSVKNKFQSKDITYQEYLGQLQGLKSTFQSEHPDFYSNVFESTLNATIAEATGNVKDLDFNNKLSNLQVKYQNHSFDKDPLKNAKSYQTQLDALQGTFSTQSPEYTKLTEMKSSINNDIVDMKFNREYESAYNDYKLNQTQKGLEKYLTQLNKLKKNDQYSLREDIVSKLDGDIASATGDVTAGEFKQKLSNLQKQLNEGKLKSYGDGGASTYRTKINELKETFFGKNVDVKLSADYKTQLENEIQGNDGSLLYKTLQTKLADFTNKYERGELTADQVNATIGDWKAKGYFGDSQNITHELDASLTSIQTEIAKKNYETYTKSTNKLITAQQEAAARTFNTKLSSFNDIQSSYGAGKTDFATYEAARKSQADVQTKYENYLKGLQQVELPQFKFENFNPGTTYKQPSLQDLGINSFKL